MGIYDPAAFRLRNLSGLVWHEVLNGWRVHAAADWISSSAPALPPRSRPHRPKGEFPTPSEALLHISSRKGVPMERLTIPSQRRYLSYFASVVEGVRPRSEPLLLRRVIMNTIPTFGRKSESTGESGSAGGDGQAQGAGTGTDEGDDALGCCPYLQVFKGGALLFTATYQ